MTEVLKSPTTQACEFCEGAARLTSREVSFAYGEEALSAEMPVWACDDCGASYRADGAEEVERRTIYKHLGRLSPEEVRAKRAAAGLSQEAFARQLGVGRVTVARWETGQQIPSSVYDRMIRMFATPPSACARRPRFRTPVDHKIPASRAFTLISAVH